MKTYIILSVALLLLPCLVACTAWAQVGAEATETPSQVAVTPTLSAATLYVPNVSSTAEGPGDSDDPQGPVREASEGPGSRSGLVCLNVGDGTVYLPHGDEGARILGSLPGDASDLALGKDRLAYVSHNRVRVLDLVDGTMLTLHDFGERRGHNYSLHWLPDGASLAYSVSWEEPSGSRLVELGVFGAEERIVLDRLTARPAGPTPTLPAERPPRPGPGFVGLRILGYESHAERLVVTPVGGEERYNVIWFYDMDGERVEMSVNVPAQELALSPQAHYLAVSVPGQLQIWLMGTDAPPKRLELPPETHAGWLSWSPDQSRLAYLVQQGSAPGLDASPAQELVVWETRSGEARPVLPPIDGYASLVGWAEAGCELILTATDTASGKIDTSLVDVESGGRRSLDLLQGTRVIGWIDGP
jgi:hypothetical protein